MVNNELRSCLGTGRTLGYRGMCSRIRQTYKVHVSRQLVYDALRHLDPEGVEWRHRHRLHRRDYRSPGPNWVLRIVIFVITVNIT